MRNGQCPKCSSPAVYVSDANGVQLGLTDPSYLKIMTAKKWIDDVAVLELAYYVCRDCGYFEQYVRDLGKLAALDGSSNWRNVGGAAPGRSDMEVVE